MSCDPWVNRILKYVCVGKYAFTLYRHKLNWFPDLTNPIKYIIYHPVNGGRYKKLNLRLFVGKLLAVCCSNQSVFVNKPKIYLIKHDLLYNCNNIALFVRWNNCVFFMLQFFNVL